MTKRNVLAFTKPKNKYIQQHEKRSRAVAVDRKSQAKNHWDILYVHA